MGLLDRFLEQLAGAELRLRRAVDLKRLAGARIARPRIPVVNNVDVRVEEDPVAIRDALYRQAFGPVRWVETIEAMRDRGARVIVECGPGRVLAGLVKRIDAGLLAAPVFDPASLAAAREVLA